jgi:hypothetical protein
MNRRRALISYNIKIILLSTQIGGPREEAEWPALSSVYHYRYEMGFVPQTRIGWPGPFRNIFKLKQIVVII